MADLHNALQQLRNERTQAQLQVEKLDSAISVLEGLLGRNSSAPLRRGIRRVRIVSAAARRRMAAAQRARRARERAQAQPTARRNASGIPKRRTLSPAGRNSISAAAKG